MIFKPELSKKEQVLSWYDARENSCFVLCTGVKMDSKQIFSKWVSDDNIAGREKLEIALNFIVDNPNNFNTYTIVSFPYEEGIETSKLKDLEGETIRFQFNNSSYSTTTLGSIVTESTTTKDYGRELLLMMKAQNDALQARLDAMQDRLDEEEEQEEEDNFRISGKERLMGALAGIVERPEFTDTLMGIVGLVVNKFIPQKQDNGDSNNSRGTEY